MNLSFLISLNDPGAVQLVEEAFAELDLPVDVRPRRPEAQFSLVTVQRYDLWVEAERLEEARATLAGLALSATEGDVSGNEAGAVLGSDDDDKAAAAAFSARRKRWFLLSLLALFVLAVLFMVGSGKPAAPNGDRALSGSPSGALPGPPRP